MFLKLETITSLNGLLLEGEDFNGTPFKVVQLASGKIMLSNPSFDDLASITLDNEICETFDIHKIPGIDICDFHKIKMHVSLSSLTKFTPKSFQVFPDTRFIIYDSVDTKSLPYIPEHTNYLTISFCDLSVVNKWKFGGRGIAIVNEWRDSDDMTNLSNVTSLLLLPNLETIYIDNNIEMQNIVSEHLKMGKSARQRDIPGFEHEMIEAGYEEYL